MGGQTRVAGEPGPPRLLAPVPEGGCAGAAGGRRSGSGGALGGPGHSGSRRRWWAGHQGRQAWPPLSPPVEGLAGLPNRQSDLVPPLQGARVGLALCLGAGIAGTRVVHRSHVPPFLTCSPLWGVAMWPSCTAGSIAPVFGARVFLFWVSSQLGLASGYSAVEAGRACVPMAFVFCVCELSLNCCFLAELGFVAPSPLQRVRCHRPAYLPAEYLFLLR